MESEPEEHPEQEGIIISAEYDEDYEAGDFSNIVVSAPTSQANSSALLVGTIKSKYYKQTYRTAWEHMPDFKGWLRGVHGEPTRAYCIYCQKTLHAHRLSLLKHTCTIRHQKAAQLHNNRKMHQDSTSMDGITTVTAYVEGGSSAQEDDDQELEPTEIVQYGTPAIESIEDIAQDQENEDVEEEEEDISIHIPPMQFHKQQFRQQPVTTSSSGNKPPISTYVVDTTAGAPVNGLPVSLYKLIDGRWTYINEGTTNADGRFSNFIQENDISIGRYKLHFDVDRYFESKKQSSMYPFIEIVFDCRLQGETYHIPLLLNPFGYTTYRGS